MTDVRRMYWLIGFFAAAGFVAYTVSVSFRDAVAFLLGAAGSLGNFWLFDRLSKRIAPGGASAGKPWEAGAFIGRYIILLGMGYAIVKALNVSPLAVILGLFASTAAVLASLAIELFIHLTHKLTRKRVSH